MSDVAKTIGKLLIESRIKRELSQQDFSSLLEVDINTLESWENGYIEPDASQLINIIEKLDLKPRYIHSLIQMANKSDPQLQPYYKCVGQIDEEAWLTNSRESGQYKVRKRSGVGMSDTLSKISTQWTEIEDLSEKEGPSALAEYLAVKYFDVLASKFKAYYLGLDDFAAHELASDVLYDLIKNDYRGVKRLDRDRGHLRGLFFRIIRMKIAELGRKKKHKFLPEFMEEGTGAEKEVNNWLDVYMDFNDSLKKLEQERPRLYEPFAYYYLQGKKIAEIAELMGIKENAIKQRLYSARRCLAKWLKDYQ